MDIRRTTTNKLLLTFQYNGQHTIEPYVTEIVCEMAWLPVEVRVESARKTAYESLILETPKLKILGSSILKLINSMEM